MGSLTTWMDRTLYPDHGDNWDNTRFRQLLEARIGSDDRVLDYGAGRGFSEMDFRGRAGAIAGVDLDPVVLENPFLDEAGLLAPPEYLIPYDDDSFDLVFSDNVLEHIEHPENCFREIHRVLRPGGVFVSKTPNKSHYVPIIARFTPHAFHVFVNRVRGREAEDTFPTLYRCNTPQLVEGVARATGFVVRELELWEGRPEYLRIAAPLYLLGYVYERVVNSAESLRGLRAVMVFTLKKPESVGTTGSSSG